MSTLDIVVENLTRGGISIVTRLDDNSVGAHLTIQLDGDAINRVSSRFLADPAAQQRHAGAIAEFLAQWRRARWLAGHTLTLLGLGAFASLFAAYPSWPALGASGIGPLVIRWCTRLASHKTMAAALRRVAR